MPWAILPSTPFIEAEADRLWDGVCFGVPLLPPFPLRPQPADPRRFIGELLAELLPFCKGKDSYNKALKVFFLNTAKKKKKNLTITYNI